MLEILPLGGLSSPGHVLMRKEAAKPSVSKCFVTTHLQAHMVFFGAFNVFSLCLIM
jgi:hypothetical protein